MNNYILEILKEKIEKEDEAFRNSDERKQKGVLIHSYITRKIKLEFGILCIKITKYKYYDDNKVLLHTYIFNKNVFLNDNFKRRVDISLLEKGKKWYLDGANLRVISMRYNISKPWFVVMWRQQFNISKRIEQNRLIKSLDNSSNNTIYISVDDTYFNTKQNKNKVSKFRTRIIFFLCLIKTKI
ncbi:hypothetical protein ACWXVJ_02235 [Mycoplasma sp. 773]